MPEEPQNPKAARLEQKARTKAEREARIKQDRARFNRRERNKRIFNLAIISIICLAIVIAVFQALRPEAPGQHDALAKCLTSKGAIMYGTEWCPHCQEQKRLFGTSFRHATFINCDVNADACAMAGVEMFPTWVFADGSSVTGKQELDTLAERTGCA
ncbi:TPA: thioredoxin [Candidatus Woesearchaeota archaeon]|nr:thioredoxin [Candidatus Woesearchaeota archaeon]